MHDDLLEQAREAAYLPPDAPPVWDLIEVMGRAWMGKAQGEAQGVESIASDYLAHHRKAWAHVARIEGAHPWAALEARILACPELPVPLAERSEPDSIRSACAHWRAALEGGDLREGVILDEEGRWRVWLCAWVGGFGGVKELSEWLASQIRHKLPKARMHKMFTNTLVTSGVDSEWIIIAQTNRSARSPVPRLAIHFKPWWGEHQPLSPDADDPFTPKTVAQAAQQCLIRIPDRIIAHFGLCRWQTSLGFEV